MVYDWVLRVLKEMLDFVGKMPNVFVTDRELALLNPLSVHFPNVPSMLCRRHIYKDIETKAVPHMSKKGDASSFEHRCKFIFEASTEEEYNAQRARMQEKYSDHQVLIDYLHDTWLNPYKEKIVSAWVDKFTHFGSYTSNRFVME